MFLDAFESFHLSIQTRIILFTQKLINLLSVVIGSNDFRSRSFLVTTEWTQVQFPEQ